MNDVSRTTRVHLLKGQQSGLTQEDGLCNGIRHEQALAQTIIS